MKRRPHPEADRVEVEWLDSTHHSGWRKHAEVLETRRTDIVCLSVGLLIANDKVGVTLAGSAHGDEIAGTMTIPRGSVKKVRRLWRATK